MEFNQIKRHAFEGGRVIREVLGGVAEDEYLALASDIAACHHEYWDGGGYPNGLSGGEIPLSARIMAVADVYDALVSARCYKEALSADEAFGIMREEAGTHFEPNLTGVLLSHRSEWINLLPWRTSSSFPPVWSHHQSRPAALTYRQNQHKSCGNADSLVPCQASKPLCRRGFEAFSVFKNVTKERKERKHMKAFALRARSGGRSDRWKSP